MILDYCMQEPPLALYTYDNWTHMPTSKDQECIEAVLPGYVVPQATWLHIGIGNSSLAKKFAHQVKRLDGITVVDEEVDTAPKIENYRVWWCDKHSPEFLTAERYDVIIDTTPAGHACCFKHFKDYLRMAFQMLRGAYLTDKMGLAWAQPTFIGMTPEQFLTEAILWGGARGMVFVGETVIEVRR